jgi:hypothetical protein
VQPWAGHVLESSPNSPGIRSQGRSTGAVLEGKKTEARGNWSAERTRDSGGRRLTGAAGGGEERCLDHMQRPKLSKSSLCVARAEITASFVVLAPGPWLRLHFYRNNL